METLALIAIFASAVLHAAWNAILKGAKDPQAGSLVVVLGACSFTTLLALVVGPARVPAEGVPWVLATGLIEGVYFVSLARALELLPLGTAYGLSRGVGLLLVWPLSVLLQAEVIDAWAVLGGALLSGGLFVLVTGARSRLGLGMAGVCALTIAAYPLTYKQALRVGVDPYPLFALSLALALPIQLLWLSGKRGPRLRAALFDRPLLLVLGAAACAASFLLFLVALRDGGAGRITALRNSSIVFAALFARLGGEPLTPRSLWSAAAVSAGAVLLSW